MKTFNKIIQKWLARRALNALNLFITTLDGKTYTFHQTKIVEVLDLLREHT